MEHDPYEVLCVKKDATQIQIKTAYRSLVMKWHDDKWVNASEEDQKIAKEKFDIIQAAYAILGDPEKRKLYDDTGYVEMDTNELRSAVLGELRKIITSYLAKGPDIFRHDIIKEITAHCNHQILVSTQDIRTTKEQRKFLKRVVKKFKKKKKLTHDFVSDIFRGEFNNLDQTINANINVIFTFTQIKSVINAYEFDYTEFITDGKIPDVKGQALGNIFDLAKED